LIELFVGLFEWLKLLRYGDFDDLLNIETNAGLVEKVLSQQINEIFIDDK